MSWMWEHVRDHHEGAMGENWRKFDFVMSATKKFMMCLDRHVFEDIRMQQCVKSRWNLLNSRNEYKKC